MRIRSRNQRAWVGAGILVVGIAAVLAGRSIRHLTPHMVDATPMPPGVGAPGGPPTTRDGLKTRITELEQQILGRPGELTTSVLLADALLRQARAGGDSRPAGRAESVLEQVLRQHPDSYDALRLLGAVDLSLHKFRNARTIAERARDMRPDDAWNYGVAGDAALELGDYDEAFASFDRMMQLRPGPTAYARVSYAREICGDLPGAVAAMQMASAATPGQDAEARAWYATQLGELQLKLGHADAAEREFRRALFTFAQYPLAEVGAGKAKLAEGDTDGALQIFLDQLHRTPTLDLASRIGDIYVTFGRAEDAEYYYGLAEDLAGPPQSQTEALLALFLADHNRKLTEAVAVAERIAAMRDDIVTNHALAWAYFKVGRVRDAAALIDRALRTGSRDPALLSHAATIRAALSPRRVDPADVLPAAR